MKDADDPFLGGLLSASASNRVEALLFASPTPVPMRRLAESLPAGTDVETLVSELDAFWTGRGAKLERGPDGVWLRPVLGLLPPNPDAEPTRRLSEGAVATLAVVALHQPVTIPQIEAVRRVKLARGIVESLEASGLIEVLDRRKGAGRAVRYVTTGKFLDLVRLDALSDLPTPEEILHSEIVQG